MSRKEEFEIVKNIIKERYDEGDCGLFDCRNLVGDPMETIYKGEYFIIDICYYYSYFEVFGTTKEEFNELDKLYYKLFEEKMKRYDE